MRFAFKELPGLTNDYLRPVVPVVIEGVSRAPQLCLLDSGALHNRFGGWAADAFGIDLSGATDERLAVGGFVTSARTVAVHLSIGEVTWRAPVSFCDPWPLAFHLLGQEGFFRWFDVRLRASRHVVEVTPEPADASW